MMHRHIAPREGTGDKELRGGDSALQAVGIGIYAIRGRALAGFHHPLLCQPLTHIVAHVDFKHATFGSELTAWHLPFWPLLRCGLLEHAAIVGERRAQIMATHD